MSMITTEDGTRIFYKDWGKGPPIVFSHGWPLNADAWDEQLVFFANQGFRAIAHDRRGHGRSSQPWQGNDMNTYADDLAVLLAKLDVKHATLVGHSTGGGEVTRYLGRHGTKRVAKAVLMSAVPPLMIQTPANPEGLPRSVFDTLRAQLDTNRSQFYRDFAVPFFGGNRAGARIPDGVYQQFWLQSMQVGLKAAYDCVAAFSETDFTEDLKKLDLPVLFIHGDDDQIVPIGASAMKASRLVKHGTLVVYRGGPHGLMIPMREQLHADLLRFARG